MKARLTGGLVAAALLSAGLVCPGAAVAADPAGYPASLDFAPDDIAAAAGGVYAVGNDDSDSHGYVAKVGAGEPVDLGADSYTAAVAASGSHVYVLGSEMVDDPDLGLTSFPTLWTFEDGGGSGLSQTDKSTFPADSFIEDGLGVGPDGNPLVVGFDENNDSVVWFPADDAKVLLPDDHTNPTAVAAGGDAVYVVGSADPDGDDFSRAAAWRLVKDGSDWDQEQLFLSPDEPVYSQSDDVVVDQATGVAYVAHQSSDPDSGDGTAGLAVIDGDDITEIPLDSAAWSLALSPDGETIYGSTGGSIWSMATDRLASYDDEDNQAPVGLFPGDSYGSSLAISPDGDHLYAGDTEVHEVLAFGASSAPTGVTATAWNDGSATVSWTDSVSAGGFEPAADYRSYRVTVQDNAGGAPVSKTVWGSTDTWFDGLAPGHTYTVSVVALTAFTSAAGTTQVTVPTPAPTETPAVAHPSAVAVSGSPKVGSTLSVTSTGSWSTGAALAYSWTANGAQVSTAPTLKVTPALVGKRITVSVTGTQNGYTTQTVTSVPSPAVAKGALHGATPKVTGKAKVGKTLAAKAGSWTSGTKLTYQWSANGKRIKKADGAKLKLTKALKGKKISVEVTGAKAGYKTATKESKRTAKVRR